MEPVLISSLEIKARFTAANARRAAGEGPGRTSLTQIP